MIRTLQISNILAFVVTIVMNYLSNTGVFNGNTMATVSAKYQNLFTPAGYAFSIWGIIYIALAGFIVYQSQGLFNSKKPRAVVQKIGWLFVLSCMANCLWIICWLYDYTGGSVLVMASLLAILCAIVLKTRMELDVIPLKRIAFEWWPFAMYLGWICVALIANTSAYLTKLEWNRFGISEENWTLIMVFAAVAVNILLIWMRNLRESAAIGAWGLAAVAVANHHTTQDVFVAAAAATLLLLLNAGIHGYMNRGKHFKISDS
jgi:hypothetical protein